MATWTCWFARVTFAGPRKLMSAAGYAPTVSLTTIDAGKIPGQYLFSKRDSKIIVELHNDHTLRYFPHRLPLEEFFARQIRVRVDGHDVSTLSVEDELVLICISRGKTLLGAVNVDCRRRCAGFPPEGHRLGAGRRFCESSGSGTHAAYRAAPRV